MMFDNIQTMEPSKLIFCVSLVMCSTVPHQVLLGLVSTFLQYLIREDRIRLKDGVWTIQIDR